MIRLFSDVHAPFPLFHAFPRDLAVEPRAAAAPDVIVRDVDGAFELSVDLPGVAQKDVEITLEGAILSLSAKREFTLADGTTEVRTLSRRFKLPAKADADKTTATLKDGVLRLRVAKLEQSGSRQIAVTAA